MADYIPSGDTEFYSWITNFYNAVSANPASYGITEASISDVEDGFNAFGSQLQAHQVAQNNAKTATQTKNQTRVSLIASVRALVKQIQASPTITDAKRATLGVTIPDTTPTAVSAPTSRPVVMVESNGSLSHKVKFTDELTPLSNAKPTGAIACEVHIKIGGEAPVSIADCKFLGNASKSPYEVSFDASDIGKQAHYLARWVTRTGLTSPVSQLTSWTIAG